MKSRIIILLSVVFLAVGYSNSYAGFILKKHSAVADSSITSAINANTTKYTQRQERRQVLKTIKTLALHPDGRTDTKGDNSGWEGIVALICGILGFGIPFLAIAAIVFGALGMKRGKKHHGMAVAGLVLGIIVVAILLFLILLVASFSGLFFF